MHNGLNVDMLIPQLALKRFLVMSIESSIKAKPEVAALSEAEQKAAVDKEVALKIERVKNSGILSEQENNYRIKFNFEKLSQIHFQKNTNNTKIQQLEISLKNIS